MKRILLALGLTAVLTGCDDYEGQPSSAPPVVVVEATPAAEDAAVDAADSVEAPTVPVDPVPVLPPDEATSEESVTPESETLFY